MLDLAIDPVRWIQEIRDANRLDQWCRLIFSLSFSFVVGFSISCGGALVSRQSALVSIGYGLLGAGTATTVVFRRSPLTKGLTVALPQSEAEQELSGKDPMQVITKN